MSRSREQLEALLAEREEEIAHLQRMLGERTDETAALQLRERLGLGPVNARILDRLYSAEGRLVPKWALTECFPDPDRVSEKSILVAATMIRRALGSRTSVAPVCGEGVRLTAEGIAIVTAQMASTEPLPARWVRCDRRYSDAEIRMIRWIDLPDAETAQLYGCSVVMIWRIRQRKAYAHVLGD